jgi:hypothetical protein
MLVLVHVVQVDAEEGIGQDARARWVGKVSVDYEERDEGEDEAEAEAVEADEGVAGPEDACFVLF